MAEIGEFIKECNPQDTVFINKAMNEQMWSLNNVTPSFSRIFQTTIKIKPHIGNEVRADLFDALEMKLNKIRSALDDQVKEKVKEISDGNATPAAKKELEDLKQKKPQVEAHMIVVKVIRMQATSVVAEAGSRHFLHEFRERLESSFTGDKNTNPHYKALLKACDLLEENAAKYSLDNLEKNTNLESYSGRNVLEARYFTSCIAGAAFGAIAELEKAGELGPKENVKGLVKDLSMARVFYNAKNEINYSLPTAPTSSEEKRVKYTRRLDYTAAGLGVTSLGTGVIGLLYPPAAVVAAASGVGAGIAGISSTVVKGVNAAENLLRYGALPEKQ